MPTGSSADIDSATRQTEIVTVQCHLEALKRADSDRLIKHYDRLFWRFGHVSEMMYWTVSHIAGNKAGDSSQWETDCDNTHAPPGKDVDLCFRAPREWFLYGNGDPSEQNGWNSWQADWVCPIRPFWWNEDNRWWEQPRLLQYLRTPEGREVKQKILDGMITNSRRVVGYCLYVNFLRKIDEGNDQDKVLKQMKRGTPDDDPYDFPFRIMCECAPMLELNPALYNQRCKRLEDGAVQNIVNPHEASEAGRTYRAKRRRLSDYGYSLPQTDGALGFAADVICDPQDPERRFGQEVRAAMQKTAMAITAEEQTRKLREYKECQKQALERYDAEPDAVHIKDDFALSGRGAYAQFHQVRTSEIMGELPLINGQDQVTGSSTISMIGAALSTTWVNAYSKKANRQTSHHYLQTAQKMAENMAFRVDSDGAETYRSLVNESRNTDTQPDSNFMDEAYKSGEWSIPAGSAGPVGVIGPLLALTYGREIDKDNKGLRILTGMYRFQSAADTVSAINARPANGGFVASLGLLTKSQTKAVGRHFEASAMIEPLAKNMVQFWLDGRRKKRRLANAFVDFIPQKPPQVESLDTWINESRCAVGPVRKGSTSYFAMLSQHVEQYEAGPEIGELRHKYQEQETFQRTGGRQVVLRPAVRPRAPERQLRSDSIVPRAPTWPAIRSAHITLRDDDESSGSDDDDQTTLHHKPWINAEDARGLAEGISSYLAGNMQAIVDVPEVFFQWQTAYDHVLPWHLALKNNAPKDYRSYWYVVNEAGRKACMRRQPLISVRSPPGQKHPERLYYPDELQGISIPVLWDSLSFIQAYIRRHRFLERRPQKAVPGHRWFGGRYVSSKWLDAHPDIAKWYHSLKGNGKLTDEDVAALGDVHDTEAAKQISKFGTELFQDIADKVGDRIAMMTIPEFIHRIYQSAHTGLFPPIMHAMLGRHADHVMNRAQKEIPTTPLDDDDGDKDEEMSSNSPPSGTGAPTDSAMVPVEEEEEVDWDV